MALTEEEKEKINKSVGMYVSIETDKFREMMNNMPADDKTDVIFKIDGVEHPMTLDEFKKRISS